MEMLEAVQSKSKRVAKPFDRDAEIISPRHVRLVVGISPITIWRLRREGKFPAPLRLTKGRIGWRRSDLNAWLAEREQVK
jgi:prophage regulatory protein